MSNKNEVFEYLIDQLRQQLPVVDVMGEIERWSIDRSIAGRGNYTDEENAVIDAYIGLEHNPYKQQREDLAHEVQSLKNQLRDASSQIKELREDNIKKSEHISHLTGQVKDLTKRLAIATGDVEAFKLIRKGGGISGDPAPSKPLPGYINCGATKAEECKHEWEYYYPNGRRCAKCGLVNL